MRRRSELAIIHDTAHSYSKQLALRLARTDRRYTVSASIGDRTGKVFID
jgi:hypothetical protein